MKYSSCRIVKNVKIGLKNFSDFSAKDLDRLKNNDKWLSDSHVTLALLSVYLFYQCYNHLKSKRDCFRCCASRNIWGNLKIKLFDTSIWEMLSNEPEKYFDRFMAKNNFMECDFAVIPMFEGWENFLFSDPVETIVLLQESLETRNYWKSLRVWARKYVSDLFFIYNYF